MSFRGWSTDSLNERPRVRACREGSQPGFLELSARRIVEGQEEPDPLYAGAHSMVWICFPPLESDRPKLDTRIEWITQSHLDDNRGHVRLMSGSEGDRGRTNAILPRETADLEETKVPWSTLCNGRDEAHT